MLSHKVVDEAAEVRLVEGTSILLLGDEQDVKVDPTLDGGVERGTSSLARGVESSTIGAKGSFEGSFFIILPWVERGTTRGGRSWREWSGKGGGKVESGAMGAGGQDEGCPGGGDAETPAGKARRCEGRVGVRGVDGVCARGGVGQEGARARESTAGC